MAGEFDLIRRFFQLPGPSRHDVLLGVGDDCALLQVPPGKVLAVSSDTLVSGRHFSPDADPEALGHKALAVNLSDLAAMGAEPAWASLCITLPSPDETWLARFMRGFSRLAEEFGVQLVGGDTTRGPLAMGITVQGFADPGGALRRDGARPGDRVYVSGTLGDAGLALRARQESVLAKWASPALDERLDRPAPRVELGMRLGSFSRCATDVSDGLGVDLGHICEQSGVGAILYPGRLPLSPPVRDYVGTTGDWMLPLSAGDDYELVFTVGRERLTAFEREAARWDVPVTRIGEIEQGEGVRARMPDGALIDVGGSGYDPFRA